MSCLSIHLLAEIGAEPDDVIIRRGGFLQVVR
jgi:hypothetical protein